MACIMIFAQSRGQALEMLSAARSLADPLGAAVTAVIAAPGIDFQEIADCGADEILCLPPLPEDQGIESCVPMITASAKGRDPEAFLLPATALGKEMAARLANRLDTGLCSNCISIRIDDDKKTIVMERLAYGGAALQKVMCAARPVMATISPGAFNPAQAIGRREVSVAELPVPPVSPLKVRERKAKEKESRNIAEAKVVVCVGRGFENKDDLSLARELNGLLGGEIAGTRPITEEFKWLPEDLCIGLSGASVKPDLYLGIGVSGQIQHVTGLRNARVICAINKDENAPIFGVSDLGIVGNLYDVLPKIIQELKS